MYTALRLESLVWQDDKKPQVSCYYCCWLQLMLFSLSPIALVYFSHQEFASIIGLIGNAVTDELKEDRCSLVITGIRLLMESYLAG